MADIRKVWNGDANDEPKRTVEQIWRVDGTDYMVLSHVHFAWYLVGELDRPSLLLTDNGYVEGLFEKHPKSPESVISLARQKLEELRNA